MPGSDFEEISGIGGLNEGADYNTDGGIKVVSAPVSPAIARWFSNFMKVSGIMLAIVLQRFQISFQYKCAENLDMFYVIRMFKNCHLVLKKSVMYICWWVLKLFF